MANGDMPSGVKLLESTLEPDPTDRLRADATPEQPNSEISKLAQSFGLSGDDVNTAKALVERLQKGDANSLRQLIPHADGPNEHVKEFARDILRGKGFEIEVSGEMEPYGQYGERRGVIRVIPPSGDWGIQIEEKKFRGVNKTDGTPIDRIVMGQVLKLDPLTRTTFPADHSIAIDEWADKTASRPTPEQLLKFNAARDQVGASLSAFLDPTLEAQGHDPARVSGLHRALIGNPDYIDTSGQGKGRPLRQIGGSIGDSDFVEPERPRKAPNREPLTIDAEPASKSRPWFSGIFHGRLPAAAIFAIMGAKAIGTKDESAY